MVKTQQTCWLHNHHSLSCGGIKSQGRERNPITPTIQSYDTQLHSHQETRETRWQSKTPLAPPFLQGEPKLQHGQPLAKEKYSANTNLGQAERLRRAWGLDLFNTLLS